MAGGRLEVILVNCLRPVRGPYIEWNIYCPSMWTEPFSLIHISLPKSQSAQSHETLGLHGLALDLCKGDIVDCEGKLVKLAST